MKNTKKYLSLSLALAFALLTSTQMLTALVEVDQKPVVKQTKTTIQFALN